MLALIFDYRIFSPRLGAGLGGVSSLRLAWQQASSLPCIAWGSLQSLWIAYALLHKTQEAERVQAFCDKLALEVCNTISGPPPAQATASRRLLSCCPATQQPTYYVTQRSFILFMFHFSLSYIVIIISLLSFAPPRL